MKLLKIDNIMHKVSDLQKAEKFYSEVLGLEKLWADEKAQMIGFKLEQSDSEIVITSDPNMPAFDWSFLVEDVVVFVEDFKKQGYKIETEPVEARCGKYAVLLDPDGNKIPIIDLTKFGGKPKFN